MRSERRHETRPLLLEFEQDGFSRRLKGCLLPIRQLSLSGVPSF